MAQLETNMLVHITWDSEPTEEAKNLVRVEVLKVLKDTFQDSSWLTEFVRAEVRKVLDEIEETKVKDAGPPRWSI